MTKTIETVWRQKAPGQSKEGPRSVLSTKLRRPSLLWTAIKQGWVISCFNPNFNFSFDFYSSFNSKFNFSFNFYFNFDFKFKFNFNFEFIFNFNFY